MRKTVTIDGKEMTLECNALLPRNYRNIFGRDLLRDMNKLIKDIKVGREKLAREDIEDNPELKEEILENINLEFVENITWLMLRAAKNENGECINDVKNTTEEWLASMDESMAVYYVMDDVITLWIGSQKRTSIPKKK
jgi:hypothetical protein